MCITVGNILKMWIIDRKTENSCCRKKLIFLFLTPVSEYFYLRVCLNYGIIAYIVTNYFEKRKE